MTAKFVCLPSLAVTALASTCSTAAKLLSACVAPQLLRPRKVDAYLHHEILCRHHALALIGRHVVALVYIAVWAYNKKRKPHTNKTQEPVFQVEISEEMADA